MKYLMIGIISLLYIVITPINAYASTPVDENPVATLIESKCEMYLGMADAFFKNRASGADIPTMMSDVLELKLPADKSFFKIAAIKVLVILDEYPVTNGDYERPTLKLFKRKVSEKCKLDPILHSTKPKPQDEFLHISECLGVLDLAGGIFDGAKDQTLPIISHIGDITEWGDDIIGILKAAIMISKLGVIGPDVVDIKRSKFKQDLRDRCFADPSFFQ